MQWLLLNAQNNTKSTAIFASIYELCATLEATYELKECYFKLQSI